MNDKFLWDMGKAIIQAANSGITYLTSGVKENPHALGEDFFFRAIVNFHLVTMYAKPYCLGRENPGIPLWLTANAQATPVATVGEVYDQIIADLNAASTNLKTRAEIGANAGIVCREAALALKTRVLLYMEQNDECLALCDELLNSFSAIPLDTDLDGYFQNASSRAETLWCIKHDANESKGLFSIGSMYYVGDIGNWQVIDFEYGSWAEANWSDPLMELFLRYPEDKRFKAFFHQMLPKNDGTKMVHWPVLNLASSSPNYSYGSNILIAGDDGAPLDAQGNLTFTIHNTTTGDSIQYTTFTEIENTYPVHYIIYNGEKTRVYIRDNINTEAVRFNYPLYMTNKFSGQNGICNLSSPVILRWAEVVLNRAEAAAKLGRYEQALADVNLIRRRAGLTGEKQMTMSNYQSRGYGQILDVVLDERRMEFCFEGLRTNDLIRNRKPIDRRFAGIHPWEVIQYNDSRLQHIQPRE